MRHPLARALRSVGLNHTDVAARLGVDPKTVRRWTAGRLPYPRHREALAALTGWREYDLWPPAGRPPDAADHDELRLTYAHRSAVPADAWRRLLERAHREIDVLAYSALFLAEDVQAMRLLVAKARAGVRVRIALGDPDGEQVTGRGADEGIDSVMAARISNALILFRPLGDEPGVSVRLHDTVLYNSIYCADDELLVNTHVFGCPASHAPVLHLQRNRQDGMAATYLDSIERVWRKARDAWPVDQAPRASA